MTVEPEIFCSFGNLWNHILASAVVVGSVVIRHPQSILSREAMKSLEEALSLTHEYVKWTSNCNISRPKKTLQKVQKIRSKAAYSMKNPHLAPHPDIGYKGNAELTALGGLSWTLEDGKKASPEPDMSALDFDATIVPDVHPSLLAEIRSVNERIQSRSPANDIAYPDDGTRGARTPSVQQQLTSLYNGGQRRSSITTAKVEHAGSHSIPAQNSNPASQRRQISIRQQ
ncbi:hypothetical protein M422DRAFT_247896 [Sphaerobolus stellatus SS14]|nr:hypothetical protein M422DRAFT_247896 [Sphaerobolus stellatus SS14]